LPILWLEWEEEWFAAEGQSVIHNVKQIDRGYENIEERLNALGAKIERKII